MISREGELIINVKKRGFTLIEVLITVAILGIVMTALSNFFFTNYNTLNKVSKQIDLQSEGEKGMKKIVNTSIESKGIVEVKKGGEELIEKDTAENISRIVFKTIDTSGNDIYEIFEVADNKLWHGTSTDNSKIIDKDGGSLASGEIKGQIAAEDIVSVSVKADKALKEAEGITITIALSQGNVNIDLNSQAYFRNKE